MNGGWRGGGVELKLIRKKENKLVSNGGVATP